jgi:hypothetical protein
MQRVLSGMQRILGHLFIFSTLSLFAANIFSENPFAVILGIAGFYGIILCVYTILAHSIKTFLENRQ